MSEAAVPPKPSSGPQPTDSASLDPSNPVGKSTSILKDATSGSKAGSRVSLKDAGATEKATGATTPEGKQRRGSRASRTTSGLSKKITSEADTTTTTTTTESHPSGETVPKSSSSHSLRDLATGGDTLTEALDHVQIDLKNAEESNATSSTPDRPSTGADGKDAAAANAPGEEPENPALLALRRELMESPPPVARGGYIFLNTGYEVEETNAPIIDLCAVLSRAQSIDDLQDFASDPSKSQHSKDAAVDAMESRIPILRPTSATLKNNDRTVGEGAEKSAVDGANGGADGQNGGRPTSAAVGAGGGDQAVVVEPLFEEIIDREAVIGQIRNILETKERLRARNILLQNKLGEHFRRKRADDSRDTEKSVTDQEQRYANCIAALKDLRLDLDQLNSTNRSVETEHSARLEEKRQDTGHKTEEFTRFKRQIALTAEITRTGKPLPPKFVEQLEANENRKEAEVVIVRLENIKLRNKLRRHEQLLRQKEELADGLHLIDFEQLKIENQTYNEKIEERNEELLKLRKKITNIVQVLTHVKEKLQFVQGEVIEYREKLRVVDDDVGSIRDTLPRIKQERDQLRSANVLLKQKNGLLGNESLLRDYEYRVDDAVALNARIDQYRTHHAELSAEALAIKRSIQKAYTHETALEQTAWMMAS